MSHVRTRLIAKLALVLVSLGTLLPGSLEAREVNGSPSSAKTVKAVKTAVKKSHTTVTRRYSSRASRARRARVARARASARARQWREVMEPRYKVDASGDLVPDIRAAAAIIYNPETNEVLWEENSQDQRSIASITKVMTATVFLENNPDLTQPVTIARSDVISGVDHTTCGRTIRSRSTTCCTCCSSRPTTPPRARWRACRPTAPIGFIRRMNEKAAELGLESTHYADPSGLLSDNVSSAFDMARLITHASSDERIGVDHAQRRTTRCTPTPRDQRSTARTTCSAGRRRCARGQDRIHLEGGLLPGDAAPAAASGQQVAVVVLGARSNAGRFLETRNLFNWLTRRPPA